MQEDHLDEFLAEAREHHDRLRRLNNPGCSLTRQQKIEEAVELSKYYVEMSKGFLKVAQLASEIARSLLRENEPGSPAPARESSSQGPTA
jgi:hypothetical protein